MAKDAKVSCMSITKNRIIVPVEVFRELRPLHAYRTEDWKLVRYPDGDYKSELYHISADPKELYNHAQNPEYASKLVELNAKLDAYLTSIEYVKPEKIPGGGITHQQLYGN